MALSVVVALVLAGCGSSASHGQPTKGLAVEHASAANVLTLAAPTDGQLAYTHAHMQARAGRVTIRFTNDSAMDHDIAVQRGTSGSVLGKTASFDGGTRTLTLTLSPGTYTYFCTLPGHRSSGMFGTLVVT